MSRDGRQSGRRVGFPLLFLLVLTAGFAVPLFSLVGYAASHDLHSHVLLIPFVSAYLIYTLRRELPGIGAPAWRWGALFGVAGVALLVWALVTGRAAFSATDYLAVTTAAFLCFLWAGGFVLLGGSWMKAAAFPVFFLVFMIPLPDGAAAGFEHWLVLGSAEVLNVLLRLAGVTFLRVDVVTFEFAQMQAIRVAQECSGIRSTWVLFITSLLASYLFLRSSWHRGVLVALVIPLGLLRNAFRILVLVLLCIHVDPAALEGPVHRRGGPVFFALSLVPLFAVLWWLRRRERRAEGDDSEAAPGRKIEAEGVSNA